MWIWLSPSIPILVPVHCPPPMPRREGLLTSHVNRSVCCSQRVFSPGSAPSPPGSFLRTRHVWQGWLCPSPRQRRGWPWLQTTWKQKHGQNQPRVLWQRKHHHLHRILSPRDRRREARAGSVLRQDADIGTPLSLPLLGAVQSDTKATTASRRRFILLQLHGVLQSVTPQGISPTLFPPGVLVICTYFCSSTDP